MLQKELKIMPRTVFRMSATEMDEKLILYDLEPSKCGQKNIYIYQKIARILAFKKSVLILFYNKA